MFSKGKKGSDMAGPARSAERPVAPSIISTDLQINGDLISAGEIQVDGTIRGDIQAKILMIGEPALVEGEVVAETLTVFGTIKGQIKARSVSLAKSAEVTGDILHQDLSIEKGAFLEGHCKRLSDEDINRIMKVEPLSPLPEPAPRIKESKSPAPPPKDPTSAPDALNGKLEAKG